MVLKHLHVLLLAALLAGCIHRAPQAHLPEPAPIAVVYLADRSGEPLPEPVPVEVETRVVDALRLRNLQPTTVTRLANLTARTTSQRLADLVQEARGAPYVMLVECKVVYFDRIEGRFKWTVYVKLSFARTDAPTQVATREFDVPVFLRFEHEREREALVSAAAQVGERAGRLADEFLAGQGGSQTAPSAPAPSDSPLAPTHVRREVPRRIYFVMVDRFANGDRANDGDADVHDPAAFHGGDLQGVLDHLDDIQAQGFDTVWLSPVWATRQSKFFGHGAYHGYWVEDFGQVEPRFGDRRLL